MLGPPRCCQLHLSSDVTITMLLLVHLDLPFFILSVRFLYL